VRDGRIAVRVDRDVHEIVDEEFVPRSLADDPEVVHEGLVELSVLEAALEVSCVTPVGWYLSPVTDPTRSPPCGWKWVFPETLLPLMVNVISVCRSIVPSADSPAPPFEQG
jgi:hypothetical protein